MKNLVKRKLKAGKPSIGTWITVGHPDVSMYLADLGFDWLVCDMEHGPFGPETYHFMVQTMLYNRENCLPMARIPWNDLIWAKKAMDAGATGLVIPRVETAEMAQETVRIMKYPPKGERGAGPRLAAFQDPDYFTTVNEESLVVVMIETQRGLDNIDEIFAVEGVDACFVGPSDFTLDMGIHRQYTHPRFTDALDRIIRAGEEYGVAPGMHCQTSSGPTNISNAIEQGFKFCAVSSDVGFLRAAAADAINEVKGWKASEGEEIEL
ncbi:MAG: aldolase/citrate lyase family protein [Candidatus Bathyarchaeota archaeon]|jgi:2-keto-3-deoxy-L-rhamnonate aldolase RhmA|nr:aldolase/citrate lyase family protein [Candidatus Bathyarchaeota archaeon]